VQFSYTGALQLALLRILQLEPARATIWTGAAYSVLGLCTIVAALGYSRVVSRSGFQRLAVGAGILMAAAVTGIGLAPSAIPAIAAIGLMGASFGALIPALASMLGLEAPAGVKATLIGIGASATAAGTAIGPLTTGSVAAVVDLPTGLYVAAAAAAVMSIVVALWGREPTLPTA
jgi:MFS family permease